MHALSQAPRPWNIRRRVEHRGAHQGRFHSPHRFSEARVRRKGPGAHGTGAMAGVGTGDRSWRGTTDAGRRKLGPAGRERRCRKTQAGTGARAAAGTSGRCRSRQGRVGRKEQADRKGQAQAGAARGWTGLTGAGKGKLVTSGWQTSGARSGRTRKEAD